MCDLHHTASIDLVPFTDAGRVWTLIPCASGEKVYDFLISIFIMPSLIGGDMKLLFGGFIAIILLLLYEYAVYEALAVVMCVSKSGCTQYTVDSFTPGFSHAMSLIGGLVSALVIAELAVTKPGEAPVARALGGAAASPTLSWTLTIVTAIYLMVWVLGGLAAYVIGTMWYPGKLQPLTDLGQSWLGLAVAAAYSYFGISPPAGNPSTSGLATAQK